MRTYSLFELAQQVGATIRGNADVVVSNIASLDKANEHQLTFISNAKFREKLAHSHAGILVVSEADVEFCSPESNLLIVKDPYVAYAKLAQYMDSTPKAASGIAKSAVISDDVFLGDNVSIGANTVIESGVELGDNVVIGANCFVGKNTKIGANTQLCRFITMY